MISRSWSRSKPLGNCCQLERPPPHGCILSICIQLRVKNNLPRQLCPIDRYRMIYFELPALMAWWQRPEQMPFNGMHSIELIWRIKFTEFALNKINWPKRYQHGCALSMQTIKKEAHSDQREIEGCDLWYNSTTARNVPANKIFTTHK